MPRCLRILLASAVAYVAVAAGVSAQQTGTLSGEVRDAQGALLPGVTITIESPAMAGGARQAVSGESGSYAFAALPPGVYTATFTLSGFTRCAAKRCACRWPPTRASTSISRLAASPRGDHQQ